MTDQLFRAICESEFPEVIKPFFGDVYYYLDAHALMGEENFRISYVPVNNHNYSYHDERRETKMFIDFISKDWNDCYTYVAIALRNKHFDVVDRKDIPYFNTAIETKED